MRLEDPWLRRGFDEMEAGERVRPLGDRAARSSLHLGLDSGGRRVGLLSSRVELELQYDAPPNTTP